MGALLTTLGQLGSQYGTGLDEASQEQFKRSQAANDLDLRQQYLNVEQQAQQRLQREQEFRQKAGDLIDLTDKPVTYVNNSGQRVVRKWSVSQGKPVEVPLGPGDPMATTKAFIESLDVDAKTKQYLHSTAQAAAAVNGGDPQATLAHVMSEGNQAINQKRQQDFAATERATTEQHRREDKAQAEKFHREDLASQNAARLGIAKTLVDYRNLQPTADEKRRADLAENMNENLDQLEDIVKHRPDLFGPHGAGLMTSARMLVGTSDPDIAKLKAVREYLGMASVGAHAMRNAQHVATAADAIMAGFRNSPEAILSAIQAARGSTATFKHDTERAIRSRGGNPDLLNSPEPGGMDPVVQQYLQSIGVSQ